jgi:outer membrane protein OmpA-like peptidoglycan-associated protein
MEVIGSDGLYIGTVDHVDGNRIRMTRKDSNDGAHHYVPLGDVTQVDDQVHVSTTAAALGLVAAASMTAAVADHGEAPFPAVQNRQVPGARPRGNYYLPWIVGLVGLILLVLLFRGCVDQADELATTTATTTMTQTDAIGTIPLPLEEVTLPGGQKVSLERSGLNYELERYLASAESAPRTFTFDKLNFDTGSAAIRSPDQPNVDALAQILGAYPKAKVAIVGYTDARGSSPSNARLGAERAWSVATALTAKGVGTDRVTARSGGEATPADTNATAQGQFDNRRTELVVTAK